LVALGRATARCIAGVKPAKFNGEDGLQRIQALVGFDAHAKMGEPFGRPRTYK
jgi:hypothetical protein